MARTHPKYMILGSHWLINLTSPGTITFCTPKNRCFPVRWSKRSMVCSCVHLLIPTAGYDFYLNPRKHEKTWTGHYRGSNASSETVICDNSYLSRKRVERMCTLGYTVSAGNTNLFWAGDFMHRLVHIPAVTEEAVGRYADDYDTSLELAKKNATFSVRNADSLQYFALDTYAFDIAVPEVGCLGEEIVGKNVESPAPAESAVAPVETEKKEGEESHFHVDGSEHCV